MPLQGGDSCEAGVTLGLIKEMIMTRDSRAIVNEIAILAGEGHKVTVCTATEKVLLSRAEVYEQDANVIEGKTMSGRGVLIHGAAIQVAYIDEPDEDD
jgi:hypothetical protein